MDYGRILTDMKRYSGYIINRKSRFQNSVYYYFIPVRITVTKNKTKQKIASIDEDVGKSEPFWDTCGNAQWYGHYGK